MLNIVMLEDEPVHLQLLTDFVERFIKFEDLDVIVKLATQDPENIISLLQTNLTGEYLFFLDIEIDTDRECGINLASEIRLKLPFANIVFVTSHSELSLLTLERRISPLDYIVKNIDFDAEMPSIRKDILLALSSTETRLSSNTEIFTYHLRNQLKQIPVSSVLYISSVPNVINRVILHTRNSVVEIHNSLRQIECDYPSLFRCHKAYIINPNQVSSYDSVTGLVYFDATETIYCTVSVRRRSTFRKLLKSKNRDGQ